MSTGNGQSASRIHFGEREGVPGGRDPAPPLLKRTVVCCSTHPMRTTLQGRRRGLLPSLRRVFLGHWTALAVALLALGTRAALAQTPTPTPEPPRLLQDELDLQANSNVV